jgi:hypothetical protein
VIPGQDLQLLITRLGDQSYGIEVSGLDLFETRPTGTEPACWLHDLLGYPARPTYRNPVHARLRGESVCLVLDGMEEIVDVALAKLRPLPPLIEPHALKVAIACLLPGKEGPILVLDPRRLRALLLAQARPGSAGTAGTADSTPNPMPQEAR